MTKEKAVKTTPSVHSFKGSGEGDSWGWMVLGHLSEAMGLLSSQWLRHYGALSTDYYMHQTLAVRRFDGKPMIRQHVSELILAEEFYEHLVEQGRDEENQSGSILVPSGIGFLSIKYRNLGFLYFEQQEVKLSRGIKPRSYAAVFYHSDMGDDCSAIVGSKKLPPQIGQRVAPHPNKNQGGNAEED